MGQSSIFLYSKRKLPCTDDRMIRGQQGMYHGLFCFSRGHKGTAEGKQENIALKTSWHAPHPHGSKTGSECFTLFFFSMLVQWGRKKSLARTSFSITSKTRATSDWFLVLGSFKPEEFLEQENKVMHRRISGGYSGQKVVSVRKSSNPITATANYMKGDLHSTEPGFSFIS